MKLLKNICHNEASLFKASCGYLMRLTAEQAPCPTGLSNKVFDFCCFARLPRHFVRNDSSRGAMLSPPSRRSNETLIRRIISHSEVVELLAKRAAMFGLDARIALAIFGALSVISGAALYSAIQGSKVTAFATELKEISKAWEQYYLDTGIKFKPRLTTGDSQYLGSMSMFVDDSSQAGWKGPYLSYESEFNSTYGYYSYTKGVWLNRMLDSASWGEEHSWSPNGRCTIGTDCVLWVGLRTLSEDIVNGVDMMFDGELSGKTGQIRWTQNTTNKDYIVYLKLTDE